VDGQNIILEHRFPDEKPERFKVLAAELVALNVDVLMGGAVAATYLKEATKEIPIVFMFVPDPIALELVDNLARPSGNITGLSSSSRDLVGKRLQYLKEVVPALSRVALLVNPHTPTAEVFVEETRAAGAAAGLIIQPFAARVLSELEPAFDAMVKNGMQALITATGGTVFQWRALIPQLALARQLPFCAFSRETFEFGALMSYGTDQIEMVRRSAVYADKILKGAKPGDLPVEQPTTFELLLNFKTAKALGLRFPTSLVTTATEIIE